jgi:hypothetical protein
MVPTNRQKRLASATPGIHEPTNRLRVGFLFDTRIDSSTFAPSCPFQNFERSVSAPQQREMNRDREACSPPSWPPEMHAMNIVNMFQGESGNRSLSELSQG